MCRSSSSTPSCWQVTQLITLNVTECFDLKMTWLTENHHRQPQCWNILQSRHKGHVCSSVTFGFFQKLNCRRSHMMTHPFLKGYISEAQSWVHLTIHSLGGRNPSLAFMSRRHWKCQSRQRPLGPDQSWSTLLKGMHASIQGHIKRGWALLCRCEQLCVCMCKKAGWPPPLQINALFLRAGNVPSLLSTSLSHTYTHTHSQPAVNAEEMLEESKQTLSSFTSSLPGHQGSFSLMSLFVFLQSAGSSDAGKYTWLWFLLFLKLKTESNFEYDDIGHSGSTLLLCQARKTRQGFWLGRWRHGHCVSRPNSCVGSMSSLNHQNHGWGLCAAAPQAGCSLINSR